MKRESVPFPPKPSRAWDDAKDALPRRWALVAQPERDPGMRYNGSGFVHLKFYFTSLDEGAVPSEMLRSQRLDSDGDLYDLIVTSQGDTDHPGHLYGFGCEYRSVFSVDLEKARRMAGFLGKLDAKLRQMRTDEGTPGDDYVAYVVRIARALGVRYLIEAGREYEEPREVRSLYQHNDKGRIDKLDATELEYRVRQLVWNLWTKEDRAAAEAKAAVNG